MFLALTGGALDLSARWIIVLAGLTALGVIAYLLVLLPDFVIRFMLWLLTHSIYRIRIVGPENVPLNGPALLVCNHLSFVDGLLVGAASSASSASSMRVLQGTAGLVPADDAGHSDRRRGHPYRSRPSARREELKAGHVVSSSPRAPSAAPATCCRSSAASRRSPMG
jgi:hypothetical protein